MPAGNKSTTLDGMQTAIEEMGIANTTVNTAVNAVDGQVNGALAGAWTGGTSGAYRQAIQPWVQDCRAIQQLLTGMAEYMGEERRHIEQGESDSTADAQALAAANSSMDLG